MKQDILFTCDVNDTKINMLRILYLYNKRLLITNKKQDQMNQGSIKEQKDISIDLISFSTTVRWTIKENAILGFNISYYCCVSNEQQTSTYLGNPEEIKKLKNLLNGKTLYTDFNHDYFFVSSLVEKEDVQISKYIKFETGEQKLIKKVKIKINQQSKLKQEINIVFDLNHQKHKSILEIDEVYKEQNEIIFIMKYCKGGTLYNYIIDRNYQLNKEEIKFIMKKLLKGVKHMHNLGIIHRDLKLDNIVFENENDIKSIKIIDFGFAVELGYQNMVRCGTPGYMAPEILNQEDYNELVDIYSLGSIFHVLLSGQKLYQEYQDKDHLIFLNKLNKYKVSPKIKDIDQRQFLLLMIGHKKHRPSASFCLKHSFFNKDCEISHQIQNKVKQLCFPTLKNPFRKQSIKC